MKALRIKNTGTAIVPTATTTTQWMLFHTKYRNKDQTFSLSPTIENTNAAHAKTPKAIASMPPRNSNTKRIFHVMVCLERESGYFRLSSGRHASEVA